MAKMMDFRELLERIATMKTAIEANGGTVNVSYAFPATTVPHQDEPQLPPLLSLPVPREEGK